jgi:hypothetical protein
METLFEIPACDSPRLKWLKFNRVSVTKTIFKSGDEDELGNELYPFYAFIGSNLRNAGNRYSAGGATEHDAIVSLAIKRGWKLWNE